MSDINKKSTPDQMRVLLKRMREGKYDANESQAQPKRNLDIRDMLKITRKLNEEPEEKKSSENLKNVYDQPQEEQKFLNYFRDIPVNVKFIDLEVYDNLVFWGGTVDGIIQFIYKVTPDENTSGVEFNYLEDFSPDNPQNDEIIKRIEAYYDTVFYKYWQSNILQK